MPYAQACSTGSGSRLPRGAPLVGEVLERLAADVLHDDVAVAAARGPVEMLHEVVDPHDVGVLQLGEEAPLGHRHRQRLRITGVQQPLEHHPPVGDRMVRRQIDPAEPAVRQTAHDLVLVVHHVTGPQFGHEAVRMAALGAEPFRTARLLAACAAHRRPAVRAATEPLALRDLRMLQHRRPRIGPRHLRHRHQTGAQPPARRPGGRTAARAGPRTAPRHRRDPARPAPVGARAREPSGHRPPGRRRAGRRRTAPGTPSGRRAAVRRGGGEGTVSNAPAASRAAVPPADTRPVRPVGDDDSRPPGETTGARPHRSQ